MKKILALVLAVMLVVGMTPAAFAAVGADAQVSVSFGISGQVLAMDTNYQLTSNGEVNPEGQKYKFYLWDNAGNAVTKTMANGAKMTIQKQISAGGKAIKAIDLKYEGSSFTNPNQAYVQVELVDSYVATGDLDFKFSFYFLYDKNRPGGSAQKYNFESTMKNKQQNVDADIDFVYSYDVPLIAADEYVKAIKVDTGNDLIITAKMFAGKKYYARTTVNVKSEDDTILTDYPDIDTIYYLDTVNMSGSGNTVKIDIGDKLFVYNKDLEYIGTTSDDLPFSSKYYVSSKELDVEDVGDGEVETPEGPTDAENPPMGGDDVPQNINDNPGTGR